MREHPDYRAHSAARRARDKARREKRVQCEVIAQYGTRCTSNGDHTYGRVMCWTHRKAHETGRLFEFVAPNGAMLRALLDPGAVTKERRSL